MTRTDDILGGLRKPMFEPMTPEQEKKFIDELDSTQFQNEILRLRSELERVREENRWIPVSERLPEITDTYIVAMILPSKKVISVCRYYCLETDSWDSSRAPFITHWRPLPTAPEEG